MSFGSRIRDLRKELNLSQNDFGKEIGVSGTTISQYESDSRFPNQKILISICQFCNTTSDFLLGLTSMKFALKNEEKSAIDLTSFTDEQKEAIQLLLRAFSSKNEKQEKKNG